MKLWLTNKHGKVVLNQKTINGLRVCSCIFRQLKGSRKVQTNGISNLSPNHILQLTHMHSGRACTLQVRVIHEQTRLPLQKQIGCFNYIVVTCCRQAKETLVRLSITNCIRQPLRKLPRPYLTTRILQLVTTEHL